MTDENVDDDLEFNAMRNVYAALKDLDSHAQNRVLAYVCERLGLKREVPDGAELNYTRSGSSAVGRSKHPEEDRDTSSNSVSTDGLDGVSPVAQKWIKRNGLSPNNLSELFSLGVDEIDLVAKSVPGKSKRQKLRSVLLLTGIASYLGSGAPRVAHEKLKEVAGHYDAFDSANFAATVKDLAAEASGNKDTGYTLTARGLTSATELIKGMTPPKPGPG
jgi:hypothetical protein